jgi:hypothetical protein
VETFREGRSAGWVWRQVLTAVAAGLVEDVRLRKTLIAYAIAGTIWIWIVGMPIFRTDVVEDALMWGKRLPLVLWLVYSSGLVAGICALMVLPLLVAVLVWKKTFAWSSIVRALGISVLLMTAFDNISDLWMMNYPVISPHEVFLAAGFNYLRLPAALLISAWIGCRWAPPQGPAVAE